MLTPPPLPRRPATNRRFVLPVAVVVGLLVVGAGYLVVKAVFNTDFVHSMDDKFGDQHLKTTVALVELHKLRYGRYPATLKDLNFTGEWDKIALQSVRYTCNPEGTAYYLEVSRGWMSKPTFVMPTEFWRGTGYSEAVKPASP